MSTVCKSCYSWTKAAGKCSDCGGGICGKCSPVWMARCRECEVCNIAALIRTSPCEEVLNKAREALKVKLRAADADQSPVSTLLGGSVMLDNQQRFNGGRTAEASSNCTVQPESSWRTRYSKVPKSDLLKYSRDDESSISVNGSDLDPNRCLNCGMCCPCCAVTEYQHPKDRLESDIVDNVVGLKYSHLESSVDLDVDRLSVDCGADACPADAGGCSNDVEINGTCPGRLLDSCGDDVNIPLRELVEQVDLVKGIGRDDVELVAVGDSMGCLTHVDRQWTSLEASHSRDEHTALVAGISRRSLIKEDYSIMKSADEELRAIRVTGQWCSVSNGGAMDELQSMHYNPEPTEERLEWQVSPCDNAGEAVDDMCLDRHKFLVVDDVNILFNEPSLWAMDQDEHQEDPSIVQSFLSEWSKHREDELSQMMSSCPAMNLNRGCHQQVDVVDSERRVSVETVSRRQWSREHRLMELCRPGDLVTHWYTATIPESEPDKDAVADNISQVMGNDGQLSDDEDESKWSSYVGMQLRGGEQECTTIGHEQQEQKRSDRVDDKLNCASPGHWKHKGGEAVSYSLVLKVIRTCDNKSLLSFSCGVARDPGSLLVGGDYRSWGQGSTSTWWRRRKALNARLASLRRGRSKLCLSDGRPRYGARSTSKGIWS